MTYVQSKKLQELAHALIPGGCHTYSKGDDQFPVLAPGFIARGRGCHVWDVDGNEFIEYGMGLRAVTLGHAFPPVVEAAYRAMQLGSNFSRPAGIPAAIKALTVSFRYNDLPSLEALFDRYPGQIACVIMEATRSEDPAPGFLAGVKTLCVEHDALLVLDEMITGFRMHIGGAQSYFGIEPDLSTFGKALANGFALSALVGKREIMDLGGIRHEGERLFLLSTTHGAENHALAAALETMATYEREGVVEVLYRQGRRLAAGVDQAIAVRGLGGYVELAGNPTNLVFTTRDAERHSSQAFRTLFMQETIARGVIAPSFVVSFSHDDDDIDRTIEVVDGALDVYRKALDEGVDAYLVGRPVKPVNRRYN